MLVISGPNQRSVSMIPSNSSYPPLRGMLAGARTIRLQPGAERATIPVQHWIRPGSCSAPRKGGEYSRISSGAVRSNRSRKSGNCAALSGSQVPAPSQVHITSWPSHCRLKLIGGKM
jgi:hypothetical protein